MNYCVRDHKDFHIREERVNSALNVAIITVACLLVGMMILIAKGAMI